MRNGTAGVLSLVLGVGCLAGCSQTAPAFAPGVGVAERDRQLQQDQEELQRRRAQLESKLLTELRKLRESRQASSTGAAEPAGSDAQLAVTKDYDLMVFGGEIHDAFLGCLCDAGRSDSLFNRVGEHGSDLSPMSIRNKFSPYGSNTGDTSACSETATHPPLVVTSDGKSLGLLTVNTSLKRRITAPAVTDWLTRMCEE
ncbi:MAG TPA: hypothetical protein VJN18_10615 [Polyangiaceae bacterium]|nr:hypothetical protein [Polyangiaceae bacterium]